MITEIILVLFAILYYLFSVFVFGTYVQDVKDTSFIGNIGRFIDTIIISPIVTPIILGIKLGEWIKNN